MLPTSKVIHSNSYEKSILYDFSVDPETNRLVASSGDAYAYLAYLAFAHKDYASASYYLDKARTSSGYGENYETIFQWVEGWNDESPNGVALKLRFELFREKILADQQIRQIKEGKLQDVEAIDLMRVNRLTVIANLYSKYTESVDTRSPGIEGSSAYLDLTLQEEHEVALLIKALVEECGNQLYDSGEPAPVRAEEIPLQDVIEGDETNALGLPKGAALIWFYKGSGRSRSLETVQNPMWIVKNFRDLFNRLLTLKTESREFKQLYQQVRMLSEIPKDKLSPVQQSAVRKAQLYLLQLVKGRQESSASIAEMAKLPSFGGPFFKKGRIKCLSYMNMALEHFDEFAFVNPDRAGKQAKNIIEKAINEGNSDLYYLGKKVQKFSNGYKGSQWNQDFKLFLMEFSFGSSESVKLEEMSRRLATLEGFSVAQPEQTMEKKEDVEQKEETYRSRFEKLLKRHKAVIDKSELAFLEQTISSTKGESVSEKIVTSADQTTFILNEEYQKYFIRGKIPAPKISEAVFDQLALHEESAIVRVADEHRQHLSDYLSETTAVTIDRDCCSQLKTELQEELKKIQHEEEDQRKHLLQFPERHFEASPGVLAMRRLVGKGVKPSLDYLIGLWRRNEIVADWETNPLANLGLEKVSAEELKRVDSLVTEYLVTRTKRLHLQRVISASGDYLETCGSKDSDTGEEHLGQELYTAIQTRRYFSLDAQKSPDFRDLLFLENTEGIVLRKEQVETLREMLSDPNAVRQLRMGGGKSKVLLPMLAKRKASGNNLVMLMLPEELYETNCRDLDRTNRQLFGQEMHRFEFNRNMDRSEQALLKIYERLLKTIHSKGFVMTRKRDILSLRNAYIELLYRLQALPKTAKAAERNEINAEIKAMNKILKLLKDRGDVIADEVDACLDVRKEVNFSLGESEAVDAVKANLAGEVIGMILSADEKDPLYDLSQALQANTHAALSKDERKDLLEELVEVFWESRKDKMEKVTSDEFIAYVMNDADDSTTEKWVLSLRQTNHDLFLELSTFKGLINQGFETTLGRVGNVNYGRDPISGTWTIPYIASNSPHIGSEFDDDLERICFTYQDYLQHGVSYKQVYQIVARIQKRAIDELRATDSDEIMNINDTEGAKEFKAFIKSVDPDKKLPAHISLGNIGTPAMIKALVETINSSPKGRLVYCQHQVLAKMAQYRSQISSVSADLVEMVDHFGGFTGTPWNLHTYHDKINAEKSADVDGRTWALMLGRDVQINTFTFDPDRPIDSMLDTIDVVGQYQAVIDTGAYLRGIDNVDFIDRCLEIGDEKKIPVSAGVYFDNSGKIVKKQGLEQKPLPIETAPSTDLMEQITLYDQAHTVGADIKQGKKAQAIVTVGPNTFIRDLFQAVWRLREVHKEQRVTLAVSEAVKKRILAGEKRELTKEDIYQFCLMNEASRESDDNFRAEKEKIQGFPKRIALSKVIDLIAEGQNYREALQYMASQVASDDAGLFIKVRPKEQAYDQYATVKTEETPSDAFDRLKKEAKETCDKVAESLDSEDLKEKGKQIAQRHNPPANWCPSKVSRAALAGGEQEQQQQTETAQELELMIQTETQQQVEIQKESIIPMVQSGVAGHGDVHPLKVETIKGLENQKISAGPLRTLAFSVPYFEEIFCSPVFERNLVTNKTSKVSPQCVFYSNRKPVKNVLILKNSAEEMGMIIPTIHEAHGACREYIQQAGDGVQAVEVAISSGEPIIVYKTGEDGSDALPFDKPTDRKTFFKFYIQAKLFNGEIDFHSKEEVKALKSWLKQKGNEGFQDYFEQNIIAAKPKRMIDEYPNSSLFKIFQELAQPASV